MWCVQYGCMAKQSCRFFSLGYLSVVVCARVVLVLECSSLAFKWFAVDYFFHHRHRPVYID